MPTADIVDAIRTSIGKKKGGLSRVRPDDLAAVPLSALVERTGVDSADIEDVIMGQASGALDDVHRLRSGHRHNHRARLTTHRMRAALLLLLLLPAAAFAEPSASGSVGDLGVTVSASSELPGSTGRPYSVGNLLDGDGATAWVEGGKGLGVGQTVSFALASKASIEGFLVWPGYGKSGPVYTGNATPLDVALTIGGNRHTLRLRQPQQMLGDEDQTTAGGRVGMACGHVDQPGARAPHLVVFTRPVETDTMTLTVESALAGEKWADLPISEARPLIVSATDGLPGVDHARAFLRSVRDRTPLPAAPEIVTDVREHPDGQQRTELATYAAWGIPKKRAPAPTLGPDAPPEQRKAAAEAFLTNVRGQLLDVAVAVATGKGETWVIGARSGSFGDGEWLELSPAVVLDAKGAPRALVELGFFDGSPGCHDVLPAIPPHLISQ